MFYRSLTTRLPMPPNWMKGLSEYTTKIVNSWASLGCLPRTEQPTFTPFLPSSAPWWWALMGWILNLALLAAMESLLPLIRLIFRVSLCQSLFGFPCICCFYHHVCHVCSLLVLATSCKVWWCSHIVICHVNVASWFIFGCEFKGWKLKVEGR